MFRRQVVKYPKLEQRRTILNRSRPRKQRSSPLFCDTGDDGDEDEQDDDDDDGEESEQQDDKVVDTGIKRGRMAGHNYSTVV